MKMLNKPSLNTKMVQALTILSALHLFSEGVPGAEGSGEPYGISRDVVEGAARAGASLNPQNPRDLDMLPGVPALSQVTSTAAPSNKSPSLHSSSFNSGTVNSKGEAQKPELPPCSNGRGVLRFERMADVRQVPFSPEADESISKMPANVLFQCQNYCLKNESPRQALNRMCGSFDFIPGKRFSTYSPIIEFTESKCFLIMNEDIPGQPPKYEKSKDYYHYREVCYSGTGSEESAAAKDCPERFYVMERVMGKRFIPKGAREVNVNTLEECQQICLNQAAEDPLMATSICRAGTFDHQRQRCYLSTFTRRTHTYEFLDDPVFDYFENTCLDVERRCPKNKLFWTKEVNAEMTGSYDFMIFQNMTLQDCKDKCLLNKNIYCRSIEYDERSKTCVLSDEDSVSRPEQIKQSASDQNIYMELTCIDGFHEDSQNQIPSGTGDLNADRQPLTDRNLRDVQTAFQLFRNRRLELSPGFRERGRQGNRVSLAECLDACLEETSFQCRSVIYSDRQQQCKLSEYDQINGNLAFDPDFHYFENLMKSPDHRPIDNFIRTPGGGSSFASSLGGASVTGSYGSGSFPYGSDHGYGLRPSVGSDFDSRPSYGSRPTSGSSFNSGSSFSSSGTKFGPGSNFPDSRPTKFGPGSNFPDSRPSLGFRPNSESGLDVTENFEAVGPRHRLRSQYVRHYVTVNSLNDCKQECLREKGFSCRSFNFRYGSTGRENCELSDEDSSTMELRNPSFFETDGEYDFFERQRRGGRGNADVSQQCNPDGSMEFMLRTSEPFYGRIYTFGYYDRCFYRGGGSTVNLLKISAPRGFFECGTTKYGDTTTNIVVVQSADGVMTALDKRYNLTCTTVGPGDTVVTSSYIGAGLGAPIPIEYLPEESRLDSQVRLQILYNGRPTTTVAVGDPLTFRIESLAGRGLVSDIFATNVVARDPITGRAIELIDSRGCPVQTQVFPALGRARTGDGLETRFSAFKIPESNMVVFEARVRMCRRECEPAVCRESRSGNDIPSYGRRRRRNAEEEDEEENAFENRNVTETPEEATTTTNEPYMHPHYENTEEEDNEEDEETRVNEVIRVYLSEDDAQEFRDVEKASFVSGVCVSPSEYYSILGALLITLLCLLVSLFVMGFCFRRHRKLAEKNAVADSSNPTQTNRSVFPGPHPRTVNQPARYFPACDDKGHSSIDLDVNISSSRGGRYSDPSEPIYTDPSLFERQPKEEKDFKIKGSSSRL